MDSFLTLIVQAIIPDLLQASFINQVECDATASLRQSFSRNDMTGC